MDKNRYPAYFYTSTSGLFTKRGSSGPHILGSIQNIFIPYRLHFSTACLSLLSLSLDLPYSGTSSDLQRSRNSIVNHRMFIPSCANRLRYSSDNSLLHPLIRLD